MTRSMNMNLHPAIRRTRVNVRTHGSIRCLLAALLAVAVSACNTPRGERFAEITVGLSQAEVREILGEPSSRRLIPEQDREALGYAERWQYGDTLSTLATDAMFPDAPDSRVYAVFFDAEGRVIDTQRPDPWQPEWQDRSIADP